jgi:hypothetical protein
MLEGLISFLPEEHSQGIGAINSSKETRKRLAESSGTWRCQECGITNEEIWTAHNQKLEEAKAQHSATESPSKVAPVVEEAKQEEEIKRDEECQTQAPPVPEEGKNEEPEVSPGPEGDPVIYPTEEEIRGFVGKMDAQILGMDILIAVLTAVLVWYLYFSR